MKKAALSLLSAFILFAAGCKSAGEPGPNTGGTYQPVTKGSTWNYTQVYLGQTYTSVHTMTGSTATFEGKKYYAVDVTTMGAKAETIYYGYNNGIYSLRTSTVGPAGGTPFLLEIPYLKDDVAIGAEWEASVPASPIPAKVTVKVFGQNENRLLSDKSYKNVMYVEARVLYDVSKNGSYRPNQEIRFYIAKDIGIIQTITAMPNTEAVQSLTSYSIK